jgi:hypothetical protein
MASLAIGITIGFGLLSYYAGNDNKKGSWWSKIGTIE